MKKINKFSVAVSVVALVLGLVGPIAALAAGPATVNLGTAGNFVILSKTGISTTGLTSITGNVGVSPAAATYITGFGPIMDVSNTFSTSSLVTGKVYAADYTAPIPTTMTTAVSDMETAYTDAAGRSINAITELGAGNIGGLTLAPGLYTWSTGVTIPTDVTLSGSANDVWIFQIAQNLDISSAARVVLSGGAKAGNIFWQVAGQTTLGTASVFNGNILDQTAIVLNTGATLNGRALAQTAVTLDSNAVTMPAASNNNPSPTATPIVTPTPTATATPTPTAIPTPTPQSICSNLYWFDNTNTTCQSQRQFCGAYMYQGLQTFNNQQNCLNAVATHQTINNTTDTGCLPGNNFSITTGRNCNAATPNANALANANANASFQRNLTVGTTGTDVKALQVWLNTHGYMVASSGPGSSGNETATFGGLTRSAVAKLQAAAGISPTAGYFGPITRAYVNAH